MKVLLTGATGFIGSRLLAALLGAGHDVIAVKRSTSATARIDTLLPRIKTVDADRISLADIFSQHPGISAVIHTATSYGRDEPLSQTVVSNIVWPLQLLEALKAHQPGGIFVNTGTSFTKNRAYSYLQGYIATKAQFTELARAAAAGKDGLRLVNMKLEHPYGPGDSPAKFVTSIIRTCLRNQATLDLTPGLQERDFIYLDDVIAAYLAVLDRGLPAPGESLEYEVGHGATTSIREMVTRIQRISGSTTELRFGALQYRSGESMRSVADITALQRVNFRPRYSLDAGLAATIEAERRAMNLATPARSGA